MIVKSAKILAVAINMPRIFTDPQFTDRRRSLRKEYSPIEGLLWLELRHRRFYGLKFRRQHSIGPYVVDFYCPKLRLAIEVDGDSHFLPGVPEDDRIRETWIRSQNVKLVRFTNDDIIHNLEGVLIRLDETAQAILSSPTLSSPRRGGR